MKTNQIDWEKQIHDAHYFNTILLLNLRVWRKTRTIQGFDEVLNFCSRCKHYSASRQHLELYCEKTHCDIGGFNLLNCEFVECQAYDNRVIA